MNWDDDQSHLYHAMAQADRSMPRFTMIAAPCRGPQYSRIIESRTMLNP